MAYHQNPLGFTKETAALLSGLKVSNLSEFEKREINFDDLKYLTDEDLAVLNVGDKFDHDSFNKMRVHLKRRYSEKIKLPADVIKMLGVVRRQLEVVEVYIKCVYHCSPGLTDYFLENDNHLRVSEALLSATDSVLDDLKSLDKAIDNFQPRRGTEPTEIDDFTIDKLDRFADSINEDDGINYGYLIKRLGIGIVALVIIKNLIF